MAAAGQWTRICHRLGKPNHNVPSRSQRCARYRSPINRPLKGSWENLFSYCNHLHKFTFNVSIESNDDMDVTGSCVSHTTSFMLQSLHSFIPSVCNAWFIDAEILEMKTLLRSDGAITNAEELSRLPAWMLSALSSFVIVMSIPMSGLHVSIQWTLDWWPGLRMVNVSDWLDTYSW